MANVELYPTQIDAIERMHNACVLNGAVGSGKSRTGLAYVYLKELKGSLKINGVGEWGKPEIVKDVYIITTPKKRDSGEWEGELIPFGMSTIPELSIAGINVYVDSWNNIKKYTKIYGAVFIFDEQKAIGRGRWSKSFIQISRRNHWIMLTGTFADNWNDAVPVFIACGYFKNRTEFNMRHVVFKPYMNYPVIDHYVDEGILMRYKKQTLIDLDSQRKIKKRWFKVECLYDKEQYKRIWKDRWDIYDECPIEETGKLFYLMRRLVNTDQSRILQLEKILLNHPKVILFYNFTPELYLLREALDAYSYPYAEWNGEKHEKIPKGKEWVYLCQYTAAAEGWNCTSTDTVIFFSLSYSYKTTIQAAGRIDRSNTPFEELNYYKFQSYAPIDLAINKALSQKRDFNNRDLLGG